MIRFFFEIALVWGLAAASLLQASTPLRVETSCKAGILINAETGAVLWEKNAHMPMFPASTTKLITALYALEQKGDALDEMATASHDALCSVHPNVRRASNGGHPPYRLEVGGSQMGLKPGETLPLRTLFYGLMLASGNDAANVIAEHVSGDISAFMRELNAYVRAKGCRNTLLHTPHGLYHPEHKTTAYDMALLAREALKIPFLCEVAKSPRFKRLPSNKQGESVIHQHNALVKPGKFYYPKAIGFKTGWTVNSGFTLVAAAQDEQRTLIAVIFDCEKLEERYKDAIALFEAAFNEKKVARTLFSRGFDLFRHPIEGGKAPVQGSLSQDLVLHYFPSEEPDFKTDTTWEIAELPVAQGEHVGQVRILSTAGKTLASAPLFAVGRVEGTFRYHILLGTSKIKKKIGDHIAWIMAFGGVLTLTLGFYYSHKRQRGK